MNRFDLIHDVQTEPTDEKPEGVKYKLYLTVAQDHADPPYLEVGFNKFQFESWEEYEFFVRMCDAHRNPFHLYDVDFELPTIPEIR